MNTPIRIQRKRTKGWKMPANTVYVGRPTVFGNPFTVKDAIENGFAADDAGGRRVAVEAFRDWVSGGENYWCGPKADATRALLKMNMSQLRGKNLACWCPLDQPCHADVLLELANGRVPPQERA